MSESQESGLSFKDRLKMFENLSKSKESTESLANKILESKSNKSRASESSNSKQSLTSSYTPTQHNLAQSPVQPKDPSSQSASQPNPTEEVKSISVKDRIRAFSNSQQATQPAPVTIPASKTPKASTTSPSKPAQKPDSPAPPSKPAQKPDSPAPPSKPAQKLESPTAPSKPAQKLESPPTPTKSESLSEFSDEDTIPTDLFPNTSSKVSAPPALNRKQTESDDDLFLYPRKSFIVANLSEFLSRPRPPPEEFFEKIALTSSIDNYDIVSIQLSKPLKHRGSASKATFTDFP
jgi:hypothetical protein